jgi:hypothetical protein
MYNIASTFQSNGLGGFNGSDSGEVGVDTATAGLQNGGTVQVHVEEFLLIFVFFRLFHFSILLLGFFALIL